MNAFEKTCWLLVVCTLGLHFAQHLQSGDFFECMEEEVGNPLVTPCDECYENPSTGKYETCDSNPNPFEWRCTDPTNEDGIICEENEHDCTGDLKVYAIALLCANDEEPTITPDGCTENPSYTYVIGVSEDTGDDPECPTGGGPE